MDKAVPFNRPDITLVDETKKETAFIGIATPLTHNIQPTTAEKQRIWPLKPINSGN